MRDPALFSQEKVWTSEESRLAELLLQTVHSEPQVPDDSVVERCWEAQDKLPWSNLTEVWQKLNTFPHIFEVAAPRGALMDYDLNGQRKTHQTVSINNIVYRR